MSEDALLLTADEVSARLRISEAQVRVMMRAGALPVVKIGRLVRVPVADLHEWVAARERVATAPKGPGA